MKPLDKIITFIINLYWSLKAQLSQKHCVYITTEDFKSSGGKLDVRVAHIWPNTQAVYDPDIIRKCETDKVRYIPAVAPRGGVTGQGYYDTVDRVFRAAYPPIKGTGNTCGDYNIGW